MLYLHQINSACHPTLQATSPHCLDHACVLGLKNYGLFAFMRSRFGTIFASRGERPANGA